MSSTAINVADFEKLAKDKLAKMAFQFYAGGADSEWTLRQNSDAFKRIRIRPRVLVDVRKVDISTEVLCSKLSMPIMVAPTGFQKLAHPDGELATARATSAAKTIMVLSSSSNTTLEDVSETGPGERWFQLYIFRDREGTAEVVRRAERAGYKAIVLTVDTPRLGNREADVRNRFALPTGLTIANFVGVGDSTTTNETDGSAAAAFADSQYDPSLSWEDIDWLRGITSLPILLKGIMTTEDALLAVKAGVAGIIVSNHGARQLDYVPASLSVLEEIVQSVAGKIPVLFDGGVRRGTDIFKALALGAAAVLVGRPVVYGLAVDGEAGVAKVLRILRNELELAMVLAGCPRVQDISRSHVLTPSDEIRKLLSML